MALQKASLRVHETLPQMVNGLCLSLFLVLPTVPTFHPSGLRKAERIANVPEVERHIVE